MECQIFFTEMASLIGVMFIIFGIGYWMGRTHKVR